MAIPGASVSADSLRIHTNMGSSKTEPRVIRVPAGGAAPVPITDAEDPRAFPRFVSRGEIQEQKQVASVKAIEWLPGLPPGWAAFCDVTRGTSACVCLRVCRE